ncbi:MAG: MBL fold metallo-hydrolase [Pseudomonadota bacterium]
MMSINRRTFFAGAAGAGLGATLAPTTVALANEPAPAGGQAPAFHRITIGNKTVTALADGHLQLGAQVFPNVSEEEFSASLRDAFLPEDAPYAAPVNAYLVDTGDGLVLIDSGATSAMAPTAGKLSENLAAAGVSGDDISAVLITHLHPDHIGGMTGADGAKAFPNAQVLVREEEAAFWTDPATRAALPASVGGMIDAIEATLGAYEGSVTRFSADGEVVPGVEAMFLPGHTPGHTGFMIADGDDAVLIWGDIVHSAPVQMANPERFIMFDGAPEVAVETRKQILDRAVSDRLMIAGMHMPFPGAGHIVRDGEGYRFVVLPWQYG